MYDYNTTRSPLMLKEYGRNIQKLMEQIATIEDKTVRTQKAHGIVKLMEMVNPNAESPQKRWDDLFILSDYKLDIDSPNPKPIKRENSQHYYAHMPFMQLIRYKYYGRHIESLVKKTTTLPTLKEQEQMLIAVGKLMRRFSSTWNNDYINNERIIQDIKRMLPDGTTLDVEIIRTLPDEGANGQKPRSKHYVKSNAAKK
ncbi:MAG: DUF4290 domain-containing protein [Candidatus Cardinium sp.]|uniref:DUF4290 domain-containing protein n=1 Tax=Cardinium endosymbiont of Dermatophagoides farinae TaxID=2597823 RepID=UPI0011829CA6|nr:DUF4290 domain-containing protein [Cardinium endosymbiont of Dermatophagoides farinae]TSJ80638.1 DUF4290 domain-containing protein [Cardinium endosymbiont of Dermatophagoides farinae]UWW96633.1 MAG: DUF4290 domain-containing protein [Candidatus Cardinium sp.]